MPCGMKYVSMATDGSMAMPKPDAPMPMRLIDSTPPPMVRSFWPDITWAAARFTASSPEAQNRLIWTPGTAVPSPAFNATVRAISAEASPTDRRSRDHILDLIGPDIVAGLDRPQRLAAQFDGRHLVQGAIGLALAARRADVIVDECFGHRALLCFFGSGQLGVGSRRSAVHGCPSPTADCPIKTSRPAAPLSSRRR